MPVQITRLGGGKVRVSTPGRVKAKATTLEKARAQARLLLAIEHSDRQPTGQPAKKKARRMSRSAKLAGRMFRKQRKRKRKAR